MAERVAQGTIDVMGEVKGKNTTVISTEDISDKAFRRCMTGVAACQFFGVECSAPNEAGNVEVSVMCDMPSRCGSSDESLQTGLDRLRAAAPAPKSRPISS